MLCLLRVNIPMFKFKSLRFRDSMFWINVFIGLWCLLLLPGSQGSNQTQARSQVEKTLTQLSPNLKELFNLTKSCVKDLWSQSDAVKERFSYREIAGLCARKINWARASETRRLQDEGSQFLTRRQRAWLRQLSECSDLNSCLCPDGLCDDRAALEKAFNASLSRTKRQSRILRKSRRKEIRTLTDGERERFHHAMNRLKTDEMDGRSKYDILVYYHQPEQAPGAHWGPAFLPWHREFLRQLEVALRSYDLDIAIPYWDSRLDEGLPRPEDSVLWSNEFMGASDLYLEDGPYKDWETIHNILEHPRIVRNLAKSKFGSLYRPEDFQLIMAKGRFEELTSCVDPYFELVHGAVHLWVGGHMADIPISPNDPLFFLHHSFLDYIWEEWRRRRQHDPNIRQHDYPPKERACNPFHYANTTMMPFQKLNRDGLSDQYTKEFYDFAPSPTCAPATGALSCSGPYLFCDHRRERCLSRVKAGGNCTGYEGRDICLDGYQCLAGLCEKRGGLLRNKENFVIPLPTGTQRSFRGSQLQGIGEGGNRASFKISQEETRPSPPISQFRKTQTPHGCQCQCPGDTARSSLSSNSNSQSDSDYEIGLGTFRGADYEFGTEPGSQREMPKFDLDSNFEPKPGPEPSTFKLRTASKTSLESLSTSNSRFVPPAPVAPRKPLSPFPQPKNFKADDFDLGVITPDDNVWFSITVLQGRDIFDPRKVIVGNAKIETVGAGRDGNRYKGYLINREGYPYHRGAAYVKVQNPQTVDSGTSVATLSVQILNQPGAVTGPTCQAYCRKEEEGGGRGRRGEEGYVPCPPRVTLDVNLQQSDPIPYTPYPGQVKIRFV